MTLTVEFVLGDGISVEMLLNTFKLPSRYWRISDNMAMSFIWMQPGSGDHARKAKWGEILH